MKKKREVEYTVCDSCENEIIATVTCAKCNKEVCRNCYKTVPFESDCFCKDCYGSNLKQICVEFEKEWSTLMSQNQIKCDALFDKYKKILEKVIEN